MTGIEFTRLSSKGQVVIPRRLRQLLKLIEGTLFVINEQNGTILLKKIEIPEVGKYKKLSLEEIKDKIIPILKKNHVTRAGIFGSHARGEQKEDSDIDILIEIDHKYNEKISLLDIIGLKQELEDILGKKVDLVEYSAIHPLLKKRIMKEEIRII